MSRKPALRLPPRMLPTDAFFWYAEAATPELRPLVAGLFLLDRCPERDGFLAAVENMVGALPRFRQRVLEPSTPFGLPVWEDEPNFDLGYHLREIVLPAPGSERHLLEYASEVFSTPLDHMRPLWEGHLIEGLDGGRAAFLLKVHHSVVDGVGSVVMFDVLTQARRGEAVAHPRRRRNSSGNHAPSRGLASGIGAAAALVSGAALAGARAVIAPRATAEQLRRGLRSARRILGDFSAGSNSNPLVARSTGIGRRLHGVLLPLPRMKRIKGRLGVTLNDLVLTAVSGALGRYHSQRRMPVAELNCMVPMNLRRETERGQLGNRVGAFYVVLPAAERNPLARLERIRAQTTMAKQDRQGAAYQTLMQASALLPAGIFRAAAHSLAGRVHLICTNVPGPPRQRYLAGAKVDALYPFAPVMLGTPLSIALVSYGPTYGIGIDADPAAVPDPEHVGRYLTDEIDRIERLAERSRGPMHASSPMGTSPAPKRTD
jgi:WS/DGAT/MGAT family acyltransferase